MVWPYKQNGQKRIPRRALGKKTYLQDDSKQDGSAQHLKRLRTEQRTAKKLQR
jgi:hypothetical protein